MAGAIEITRRDLTPAELRRAAGRARDGRVARRMLAIALVLEGVDGGVRQILTSLSFPRTAGT